MKKISISIICIIISGLYGFAQPFSASEIMRFDQAEDINLSWADINEDGKLDLVGFKHMENEIVAFALIQNNSTDFQLIELPFDNASGLNFQLKDVDHNGWIDVIYPKAGIEESLVIALNQGNLSFELQEIEIYAKDFLIHDLDADGDEDLLVCSISENDKHFIIWIEQDTSFRIKNELMNISLISESYHLANEKVVAFIRNHSEVLQDKLAELSIEGGKLQLNKVAEFPYINSVESGDLNNDGRVDFVINSIGDNSVESNGIYYQNLSEFEVNFEIIGNLEQAVFSIADIDLDGLADILATGQSDADTITIFYKNDGEGEFTADSSFLEINSAYLNLPADIDDDGDLDLLSVVKENNTIKIYTQINQTILTNVGPELVMINPPLTIYNQTFFSWEKTADDHTDSLSISYELFIWEEASVAPHVMPGYDLNENQRYGFRKVVGHGYQWFDNSYTARVLENGRYYWGVVGVDNAFYASNDIRSCPCLDFYTPVNCFDLIVADTTVCFNTEITIDLENGDDSISWYSVKRGFISKSPELTFRASEPDTIYAYYLPKIPCNEATDRCVLNYSLAIDIEIREEKILDEITICQDSLNLIQIDGEWEKVNWWYNDEIVASGNEIELDSIPKIPLVVELFDEFRCPIYDTLSIKIKEEQFEPGMLPTTLSICKDQVFQIDLFSSEDQSLLEFLWSPPDLFNEPEKADPSLTASTQEYIEVKITEDKCFVSFFEFELEIYDLPTVTTNGDQFMFQGEQVLLVADGALSFEWMPEDKLLSPRLKSTLAEPAITTTYTVTGTDENGCFAKASLTVNVKNSVFIPDLFSPNGDGNNDNLLVYGEGIQDISFRVFDERGSLVYEMNVNTRSGWNGTYSGNELPTGTYFWTVNGQFIDGQPLSYQGKNKGTVRLVR